MKSSRFITSRRKWFKLAGTLGLSTLSPAISKADTGKRQIPTEPAGSNGPRVIGIDHEPQLFIDDYLLDNYWAVNYKTEAVMRIPHQPRKNSDNPVLAGNGGYVNVVHDKDANLFRMWYQDFWIQSMEPFKYTYGIAYAESEDGINWRLPRIGKYSFKDTPDNNIVFRGSKGEAAACPFLIDAPDDQKRGYKFVMLCTTAPKGMHLIGSMDGISWEPASQVRITPEYGPDTQSSILWDPRLKKYVCFTRATNIYGDEIGRRRKIARLEHTSLWDQWPVFPENILIPDEKDTKNGYWKFYGMPTRYYGGIYWGFLWPYSPVTHKIHTELAFSRNGYDFHRFAERAPFIPPGAAQAWDYGMILGSSGWVEAGDEWLFYYFGTKHDHAAKNNIPGIGMARLRKEGFASLRSPAGGGYIITRMLRWPGGKLCLNADAGPAGLTVKVTDYHLKPIEGFDPEASLPVTGDNVRHEVKWKNGEISALKGKVLRLEFSLKGSADVYGFRAVPQGEKP